MESVTRLGSVTGWCVMVQREVADRFFAAPRTKAYGAVSVLTQLGTRRTGFHAVARTVFRPPPRVDSALVAFERVADAPDLVRIGPLVVAAFAHRRKTLANSLALTGHADRGRAAAALERIGHGSSARAESLAPPDFVALADELDR
jgi:16S rRNA (adenine1518-N6/adenine1519-N6)-dimethyltransferase